MVFNPSFNPKIKKSPSELLLKGIYEVPGEPLFLYFAYLFDKTQNIQTTINQYIIYFIDKIRLNEIKNCSTNVVPNKKEPLSL